MNRKELLELLIHAEIDGVELDGPEHEPYAIDEIVLRFRWIDGSRASVRLVGDSESGLIQISEPLK